MIVFIGNKSLGGGEEKNGNLFVSLFDAVIELDQKSILWSKSQLNAT